MMKTVNILLVEDNEGDIVLTLEAFKAGALNNEISITRDGEETLDFLYSKGVHINAERPDLILLDINIPKINGLEVLSTIKNDSNLRAIPVIILTTSSANRDVQEAYSKHANCYVVKPIDFAKFIDAVAEIESFWFTLVTTPKE
jgi:two-component system, chemotaxis family, response regulator Rcp1